MLGRRPRVILVLGFGGYIYFARWRGCVRSARQSRTIGYPDGYSRSMIVSLTKFSSDISPPLPTPRLT